jgi:hypothetical protein
VRSPRAATGVTAPVHGTSRTAWRASTTGARRHGCTGALRACSRRARRAVWSLTARLYSWNTICCAGVGQTTSLSHRRCAGPQGARPVERLSCRSRTALRRHFAALRAWLASARARHRARSASSSPLGPETGGRSPERIKRASVIASRRLVLTRSPGFLGINEGAMPQQTGPFWVR